MISLFQIPSPLKPLSSVEDLKRRLDWGEPALTIVDVRDRSQFNQLHIQGAASVPATGLLAGLASLEAERDIYIYADTDAAAAKAAGMLSEAGYKSVAQLLGGLESWKAAGYPVEAA